MSENTSIYGFDRHAVQERFADHITGSENALFLVLCSALLGSEARDALTKAADSLGWGENRCFVTVNQPRVLTSSDVFELVEALDPVALCIVGPEARVVVKEAYACTLPTHGSLRLFGRNACVINDLDSLLQSEAGKRSAWALLKNLTHTQY